MSLDRQEYTYAQSGKKSLSVAITDEFYTIDLMETESAAKLTFTLNFKVYVLVYVEGKTFPRSHKSQRNSTVEKWRETLRRRVGSNSDFMIPDAFTFRIILSFDYLDSR